MINIIDIGANPIEGVPSYMPLVDSGQATLWGFEPQPLVYAELKKTETPFKKYLPYAIGDGENHEIKVCASSGMTSLLEPNFENINLLHGFSHHAQIIDRSNIQTVTLDALWEKNEIPSPDLLRMDVQGSEFMILSNALTALNNTSLIELEVSFLTLYHRQAGFEAITALLNCYGFRFLRFLALKEWPTDLGSRVIEGDVVFFNEKKSTPELKKLLDLLY